MSWTRLDDNWTRKIRAMRMEFQTRWHYLEMIQFVSGSDTFEAPIRPVDARTCSDVDDPLACLAELEALGLVSRDSSGDYVLVRVSEHIPPPEVRDRTAAERDKKRRQRAHAKGNHSLCSPANCQTFHVPGTVPGTDGGQGESGGTCPPNVPGTVRTGQGGHGQGSYGMGGQETTAQTPVPQPRQTIDLAGIDEDDYLAAVTADAACSCRGYGCRTCRGV